MPRIVFNKHPELGNILDTLHAEAKTALCDGRGVELSQLAQWRLEVDEESPSMHYMFPNESEVEEFLQELSILYARLRLSAGYKAGLAANHASNAILHALQQFPGGTNDQTGELYEPLAFKHELDAWVTAMRQKDVGWKKNPTKGDGSTITR